MRIAASCLLACLIAFATPAVHAQGRQVVFAETLPDAVKDRTVAVDRVVGTGRLAEPGQFVVLQYEAWVYDLAAPDRKGHKFDSTLDRGSALSVLIGVNRMIPGVDRGVQGMRVGGRRLLLVPPRMGYGSRHAFGEVPPNSTLLFDIELLDVVPERNVP